MTAIQTEDLQKLLACQVHIGTRNLDPDMEQYIWKRRSDGIYLIDLQKTWEKIVLASRVLVAIEAAEDVVLISARPYGQRAILKFAAFTGAVTTSGRYTPGTFTNQIQKVFMEPRVLIVNDPRADHQPLKEASYVNVPTIAFAHTESPLRYVDVAIPANNKGKHAIGLSYWLLARQVLRARGSIAPGAPWDVMVDLFFYRDPEEEVKEETQQDDFAALAAPLDEGAVLEEAPVAAEEWDASAAGAFAAAPGAADGAQWDASVMASVGDWSATEGTVPPQ